MTSFFFGEGTHSSPHTPLAAATAGLREVVLDEDNAEIGDDEIEVVPTITQKTAIRKQNDRDIFDMWVFENNEKLIKERNSKRAQTESEEILSLKQLMASQESTRIIGSPRDYQMELFERAKTRNTIAVLDTGSGKTLIAVLLLRHVIDQELEDRAAGRPPRISFFLVDFPGAKSNVRLLMCRTGRQGGLGLSTAWCTQSQLGSTYRRFLGANEYQPVDETSLG